MGTETLSGPAGGPPGGTGTNRRASTSGRVAGRGEVADYTSTLPGLNYHCLSLAAPEQETGVYLCHLLRSCLIFWTVGCPLFGTGVGSEEQHGRAGLMHPNCKMETTVELSTIHMVSIAVHMPGKGINQQPATDYAETGRGSGVWGGTSLSFPGPCVTWR